MRRRWWGDYEVMVTAVAQSSGATAGSVTGTVAVVAQGVHVAFTSGPASLDPRDPATWNVQVTNTGNAADSFDLETGASWRWLAPSRPTP
ncbi:MAG: hypothetical protein M5U34_05225 [Chloroflexi bacterium]|nr:hypothetical protein [Chloroflexota bacterium]